LRTLKERLCINLGSRRASPSRRRQSPNVPRDLARDRHLGHRQLAELGPVQGEGRLDVAEDAEVPARQVGVSGHLPEVQDRKLVGQHLTRRGAGRDRGVVGDPLPGEDHPRSVHGPIFLVKATRP